MAKTKPDPGETPFDTPESPPQQPEAPKKQKGQIVHDPELVAMQRINRILDKLQEKAKIRVVAWLKDKLELVDQA